MTRRPAVFVQADIARALRAVRDADVRAVVELTPSGEIRIIPIDEKLRNDGAERKPAANVREFRL